MKITSVYFWQCFANLFIKNNQQKIKSVNIIFKSIDILCLC